MLLEPDRLLGLGKNIFFFKYKSEKLHNFVALKLNQSRYITAFTMCIS